MLLNYRQAADLDKFDVGVVTSPEQPEPASASYVRRREIKEKQEKATWEKHEHGNTDRHPLRVTSALPATK